MKEEEKKETIATETAQMPAAEAAPSAEEESAPQPDDTMENAEEEPDDSEAEFEKNLDETLEVLREYFEEQGLSDEDYSELLTGIFEIVSEGIAGRISRKSLEFAHRGTLRWFNEALAKARAEGELAGRNAKIREYIAEEPADQPLGDSAGARHATGEPQGIFRLAAGAR